MSELVQSLVELAVVGALLRAAIAWCWKILSRD